MSLKLLQIQHQNQQKQKQIPQKITLKAFSEKDNKSKLSSSNEKQFAYSEKQTGKTKWNKV